MKQLSMKALLLDKEVDIKIIDPRKYDRNKLKIGKTACSLM